MVPAEAIASTSTDKSALKIDWAKDYAQVDKADTSSPPTDLMVIEYNNSCLRT